MKNIKTLEDLKMFIMSANMEVFEDKEIFNKQKIVSLKNLVKDLKLKCNITTPTFSRMWKKHEKDFEGFGIYRIGNSIIFRNSGYNKI